MGAVSGVCMRVVAVVCVWEWGARALVTVGGPAMGRPVALMAHSCMCVKGHQRASAEGQRLPGGAAAAPPGQPARVLTHCLCAPSACRYDGEHSGQLGVQENSRAVQAWRPLLP